MLFLAASWSVLIGVAWSVGAAILGRLERHVVFDRVGDRFLAAVWLGVIVLANAWLATSFMVPLTPLAGAGVGAAIAIGAAASGHLRPEARALRATLSIKLGMALGALTFGIAAFATLPITYYDTGVLHAGVTKWLAQYGAVVGIGLLHEAFAQYPAWLALPAPFDTGLVDGRVGALAGGLAWLLVVLHLALCAWRGLQ